MRKNGNLLTNNFTPTKSTANKSFKLEPNNILNYMNSTALLWSHQRVGVSVYLGI